MSEYELGMAVYRLTLKETELKKALEMDKVDKFVCSICSTPLKLTGRAFMICPKCKTRHYLGYDGSLYILEKSKESDAKS